MGALGTAATLNMLTNSPHEAPGRYVEQKSIEQIMVRTNAQGGLEYKWNQRFYEIDTNRIPEILRTINRGTEYYVKLDLRKNLDHGPGCYIGGDVYFDDNDKLVGAIIGKLVDGSWIEKKVGTLYLLTPEEIDGKKIILTVPDTVNLLKDFIVSGSTYK